MQKIMRCPDCDSDRLHMMVMGKIWCENCNGWFTLEEISVYNSSTSKVNENEG